MTATPIRRLLKAKPFVPFTLRFGLETYYEINDASRCDLDDEDAILYVSVPVVRAPKEFARLGAEVDPARVEIFDLRLVQRVTVKAERMPG